MNLLTIDRPANTTRAQVTVSPQAATIIAALIAAIPVVATLVTGIVVQPLTNSITTNLEARKASAELHRQAMTIADAEQRLKVMRFLIKAGLVDTNSTINAATAVDIPHWPASSP